MKTLEAIDKKVHKSTCFQAFFHGPQWVFTREMGEGERVEEALCVVQAWKREQQQLQGKLKVPSGLVPVSFLQNKGLSC